jgi:hypothetical protein
MQRIALTGSFSFIGFSLWLTIAAPVEAQDRAGAAMAGGQAVQEPPPGAPGQPPPPPGAGGPPGVIPPAGGGAAGGGALGFAGNIGIGAIAVAPPPPIGYHAPVRAVDWNIGKFFYYPFYYYPHNYWPTQSCPWPERPGEPYVRPPAYMAYPPFLEPHWRYEWYVPQKYYRGFHFWLDQF